MPSASRKSVTLVGAGTQGRRLAYMWSSQGNPVYLIDALPHQLEASITAIQQYRSEDKSGKTWGKVTTLSPEELGTAAQNSWLVLECVPEKVSLKRKVLSDIDAVAPEDTIIATNSSSFTGGEILEGLDLRARSRVLSAHSYWPPETSAIEIMGHKDTEPVHIDVMMKQCKLHGFTPYHVKRESIGYVYNRIWAAIKREALLVAADGVATPKEIDDIFKDVLKSAKGPFEQMDTVGLDVVRDIEDHYAAARGDITERPRQYLAEFIDDGKLGVKSGRGFYEYKERK